ncbi:MAG: DedA family protein, partial [Microbacteriaceae bacterium]
GCMSNLIDSILNVNAFLAFALVGLLVFAEDAIFVGFVLPGETAAVLGGVVASRGHVQLWLMIVIVILAAIIGDTVGYEVGKHFGTRLLATRVLQKRRAKLDQAQDFLRRKGGSAVFLGRFVAFFRAVMPALAGTSRMPYPRFLAFNAVGGIVWGTGFVLLGYLAGNSYAVVANTVGRDAAAIVIGILIVAIIVWRVREHLKDRRGRSG